MATTEILLAGFGGQGILFAGKILAYCVLVFVTHHNAFHYGLSADTGISVTH